MRLVLIASSQQIMTKSLFILALMVVLASCLPYVQQIALVNSLQVGRDEDPETWACQNCDQSNKPLSSVIIMDSGKQVKCSLAVYEEYSVLAFRYTNNPTNILQDAVYVVQRVDEHACPNSDKKCKVQAEMDKMWNSIRDKVLQGLRTHTHTDRLIICGISLGGALSSLSFVDIDHFLRAEFPKIEVITFGSPRVGNQNWADWYNTKLNEIRIHIKNDPIPSLPYCLTLLCNYGYLGSRRVCDLDQEICRADTCLTSNDNFSILQSAKSLTREVAEHWSEVKQGDLKSLINHIKDYPKIYPFDVCL